MKLGFIILFSLTFIQANAQVGTRIQSLAYSYVSIQDHWNAFYNPSGFRESDRLHVAISHQTAPINSTIKTMAFIANLSLKKRHLALGASRYGYSHYKETKWVAAYAQQFTNFSLGISIQAMRTEIPNLTQPTDFVLQVGAQIPLNTYWRTGISISDFPIKSPKKWDSSAQINSLLSVGISHTPHNTILISSALIYDWKNDTQQFTLGAEYSLLKKWQLRGGLHSQPFKKYFGIEFHSKHWKTLLSASNSNYLGYQLQIEMSYAL